MSAQSILTIVSLSFILILIAFIASVVAFVYVDKSSVRLKSLSISAIALLGIALVFSFVSIFVAYRTGLDTMIGKGFVAVSWITTLIGGILSVLVAVYQTISVKVAYVSALVSTIASFLASGMLIAQSAQLRHYIPTFAEAKLILPPSEADASEYGRVSPRVRAWLSTSGSPYRSP